MRFIIQSLSVFFISITFLVTAYGQNGKIAGKVSDGSTGEPLPFVNVMVEGTTQGAATDLDGYFSIIGLRPGNYDVKASAIGYNSQTVTGVRVSIDLTTEVNFELMETSIELKEEVVVIATRPLITKDLTSSTAIVSGDDISVLPVTEFQEVLQLKAGIVGGSVRGGRSGEVVYAIDGVPVTDVYDGSTVVDVATSSIQELQFVSGAFNAEYGKALSGYVNIATKDGDNKFQGSITSYIGDYVSDRTDIFRAIDDIDPTSIRNFEGSLSGPIIPNQLFFYVNARYIYFGGWLNGEKNYNPWNITINQGATVPIEERYILSANPDGSGQGTGEIVSMNWNEKFYGQGKLTYRPFSGVKLNYNYIYDNVEYRDFDQSFSYNPDGDYKKFRVGNTNILGLTHTLSNTTFYQANFSYFFKQFKQYVYEDVNDPRWTNDRLLSQQPTEVPSFRTGGTQSQQFKRNTSTYGFKLDFTSQIDKINMIKFGIEANQHNLGFDLINLQQPLSVDDPALTLNPYVTRYVPDINDPNENLSIDIYQRKPIELSAYLQDKIELNEIIINVGFRLDYFDSDGLVLNDITDPDIYRPRKDVNVAKTLEERKVSNAFGDPWYRDADTELKFSPRLGVAFPITDRGVIHFSYGHFFQIPNFELLYQNPEFKFGPGTGNLGVTGNSNLKAQETISGEVGIQQAFTDDITIDLTAYFRDIRNLAGTRAEEIRLPGGSSSYSQYVNSDFGFVQGVILTLNKRLSDNWSATVDYTFQSAKGNASDPAATRNQIAGGEQPEIKLIKLNWDQTNTVNVTFSYASEDLWGFSLIGQYGSGYPYTPTLSQNVSTLLINSELKPSSVNVDLRAYKDFIIAENFRLSLFARVYNLFDIRNEVNVYNDSGTADFTIDEFSKRNDDNPDELVNTLDEYYRNPTFYSEPRRVEIGATFFF
ncbi:MAG: TonB-dependent receptor [Ignavibacterium sp.]|jgi:outer membrane receptor for ferrienterochelin and colicin|nr:TonB-dependent receptor [Ignavibacterium sp.]